MKRFGRVFAGIAAIMLGIGILLVAVGISRVKADWRSQESFGGTGSVSREFTQAEQISIEVPVGLLRIQVSGDDKIRFYAENIDEDGLIVRSEGDRVEIRMREEQKMLNLFHLDIPVLGLTDIRHLEENQNAPVYVLTVPENYSGVIRASLSCGKLSADGIRASELELETNVGEMSVDGCAASKLKLNVNLGALWIESCRAAWAEAECNLGSIGMQGDFEGLSANVNIGELSLWMARPESAYQGSIAVSLGQ
ncbi:MAG: DUF4097 family beta strand repeat-containing protein, partial [Lachnospiraceae bacterium]|nr:DUF4097 family beta strand repeat-containing protein [Lachnospiraceae bacterium]